MKALQKSGRDNGYEFEILDSVIEVNNVQKTILLPKVDLYFKGRFKR